MGTVHDEGRMNPLAPSASTLLAELDRALCKEFSGPFVASRELNNAWAAAREYLNNGAGGEIAARQCAQANPTVPLAEDGSVQQGGEIPPGRCESDPASPICPTCDQPVLANSARMARVADGPAALIAQRLRDTLRRHSDGWALQPSDTYAISDAIAALEAMARIPREITQTELSATIAHAGIPDNEGAGKSAPQPAVENCPHDEVNDFPAYGAPYKQCLKCGAYWKADAAAPLDITTDQATYDALVRDAMLWRKQARAMYDAAPRVEGERQ